MRSLLFLAVGAAAGIASGLFGIGGGVIIVLALLWMGFTQHTATGTSLGALLLPVGALAAWEYWRNGHMNVPGAAWIALGLAIGALGGAKIAQRMTGPHLRLSFGIFLTVMGIYLSIRSFRKL